MNSADKLRLVSEGIANLDIVIEAGRPIVFIGLNATLKSIVARSFGSKCNETWKPDLGNLGVKFIVEPEISCDEWLFLLIPDYRLVFRESLGMVDKFKKIQEYLESIKDKFRDEKGEQEAINRSLRDLDEITNRVLDIPKTYLEFKKRYHKSVWAKLHNMLWDLASDMARELKDLKAEDLKPLEIEIFEDPLTTGGREWVNVKDERIRKNINLQNISSSVSSFLIMDLITMALADLSKDKKLIIIEELEEALAPPQQILFARFLEKAIKSSEIGIGNVYLIVTTHSPYIAYAFANPRTYYFRYDRESKAFTAIQEEIKRTFLMADLLILKMEKGKK